MSAARVGAIVLILAIGVTTGWVNVALERRLDDAPREDELLYLPNGKFLKLMSLGHASLMADAVYLWAIQFYSGYERRDRYRYVEHVFDTVITELDPHYIDAYWLGALILIVESDDLPAGLRLLDKGARNNPQSWILPYLAGWECYRAGEYRRAADYFERAAAAPQAPAAVKRMRAGMFFKSGDLREALGLWRELRDDPGSDAETREIAARQVGSLQVRVDLMALERAIAAFRDDNARAPRTLEELVHRGYIRNLPHAPGDAAYKYDPEQGRVLAPAGRVLGGS